jgi:hypothetical protein
MFPMFPVPFLVCSRFEILKQKGVPGVLGASAGPDRRQLVLDATSLVFGNTENSGNKASSSMTCNVLTSDSYVGTPGTSSLLLCTPTYPNSYRTNARTGVPGKCGKLHARIR